MKTIGIARFYKLPSNISRGVFKEVCSKRCIEHTSGNVGKWFRDFPQIMTGTNAADQWKGPFRVYLAVARLEIIAEKRISGQVSYVPLYDLKERYSEIHNNMSVARENICPVASPGQPFRQQGVSRDTVQCFIQGHQ